MPQPARDAVRALSQRQRLARGHERLRPASYGDVIDVDTSIDEWRGKSFVMSHIIRRGGDVLVEGREVRVFARRHPDDPARIRAVPAPGGIRAWCT